MKKKKKAVIFMTFLIIIILIFTIVTIRYFTYKKNIKDIKKIEISTYNGYLSPLNEYIIDFDNNLVTYNYTYFNQPNEDNQYSSRNFTKEDAEYFIKRANLYGFFTWKEGYANLNVEDGKTVDIVIKFQDGSTQEINCYAKFSLTYDLMADVFYEAFGYNIL